YMPVTLEEKVVCHADNMVRGTEFGGLEWAAARMLDGGLVEAVERMKKLHGEIQGFVGEKDIEMLAREALG
ncbi:MAG: hypothetical protein J7L61_00715, partial [Thermoplasmata archaeon]|nr:hypothetical protein [Thermoplasmata archaeon]